MSVLFTAVSVEQQEIVAGGIRDQANNAATNVAIFEVKGRKNEVTFSQTAQVISVRTPNNSTIKIKGIV